MEWLYRMFGWIKETEKPEEPAEPLVFGAELKCPECETSSYLFVDTGNLDLNNLPEACVKDHRPRVNIVPFVSCGKHETCEYSMSFPEDWVNEIPQKKLASGEEIITTKSYLMCYKNFARIEPLTSGQDGKFAKQVLFLMFMDAKYPGLRAVLEDPSGSVYLDDNMYAMALEFLSDRIERRGEINITLMDSDGEVDSLYILAALDRLLSYGDVMNPDKRLAAIEDMIVRAGMEGDESLRTIYLDANMFAAIKAASDAQKKLVDTDWLVRSGEERKAFYNWLGNSMMTMGNAGMIYCIATRNQRLGAQAERRRIEAERKEAESQRAGEGHEKDTPTWKGSGPVDGVIGVNKNSTSVKSLKNYTPKDRGLGKEIEFVYDSETNTFVVGKPKTDLGGSPHQQLAKSIDANVGPNLVGGMFSRGPNGEFLTSEHSGHYGRNWTPEIRVQFKAAMKSYGIDITHVEY